MTRWIAVALLLSLVAPSLRAQDPAPPGAQPLVVRATGVGKQARPGRIGLEMAKRAARIVAQRNLLCAMHGLPPGSRVEGSLPGGVKVAAEGPVEGGWSVTLELPVAKLAAALADAQARNMALAKELQQAGKQAAAAAIKHAEKQAVGEAARKALERALLDAKQMHKAMTEELRAVIKKLNAQHAAQRTASAQRLATVTGALKGLMAAVEGMLDGNNPDSGLPKKPAGILSAAHEQAKAALEGLEDKPEQKPVDPKPADPKPAEEK